MAGSLAIRLLKQYEYQSELKDKLKSIRYTNRDYHLLFSQLGKSIGFISEARVKEAFLTQWCESNAEYINGLHEKIKVYLPKNDDEVEIKQAITNSSSYAAN